MSGPTRVWGSDHGQGATVAKDQVTRGLRSLRSVTGRLWGLSVSARCQAGGHFSILEAVPCRRPEPQGATARSWDQDFLGGQHLFSVWFPSGLRVP